MVIRNQAQLAAALPNHYQSEVAGSANLAVQEALVLNELDVVRPEDLNLDSPLAAMLQNKTGADDQRLPAFPHGPATPALTSRALLHVSAKALSPVVAEPAQAHKIGALGTFLKAYVEMVHRIDGQKKPVG